MPLSRNFYSLDEVQAVLLHTHDVFWCNELLVSGCMSEAISILFQAWLWNVCPMNLQWLVDAWNTLRSDEIIEKDVLQSTYQLSQSTRDNSLWNILVLSIKNPHEMPDTVTPKTPAFCVSTCKKEIYFMQAIFQGKAQCAWWISQYIDIWDILRLFSKNSPYTSKYNLCLEALEHYEKLLGYKSDEYDMITRCAAVLIMCVPALFNECNECKDFNYIPITYTPVTYTPVTYRYPIPVHYIYGISVRGRSKWSKNNIDQLNDIETYLPDCPFWEEAKEEAKDMYKEDFYDKYFPDGLPEDWTQIEKEKSHGGGVLGPNEIPSMWKYSRNFMSNISRYVWNAKDVNDYLKNMNIDCCIESFMKLYVKPTIDINQLTPVRKILTY